MPLVTFAMAGAFLVLYGAIYRRPVVVALGIVTYIGTNLTARRRAVRNA